MFKLALIQMHVEGGNVSQNLSHARNKIAEAAASGADIVLLPEALNLGWTHPSAKTDAENIPHGKTCQMLIESAKKHHLYLCSGLIEKEGDRVFNSAVLISSEGEVILHHQKLNELTIGLEYYGQGRKLNVCHTPFGTIGLMICADAFANDKVLSRSLCYMGADIILSPASWAVPADWDNAKTPAGEIWYDHYHSVAREFQVWIAGVSNVGMITEGPWKGKMAIGNSLVINPDGDIAAEGPYGMKAEAIIYAEIEPVERPARGCGWESFKTTNN